MTLRQPPVASSPKHESDRERVDSVLKADLTRTAKRDDSPERSPSRKNNRALHPSPPSVRTHSLPMPAQALKGQKLSAKKLSQRKPH
jgi:hypothetical protein